MRVYGNLIFFLWPFFQKGNEGIHHSFYYDDASRAILQRYMPADIARFGYTLEKRPDSGHELMAG